MVRQKVTISLDPRLVTKIDEDRGLIPRSAYIEKLLKETTENKSPQNPSNPILAIPGQPSPVHANPTHPIPPHSPRHSAPNEEERYK